MNTSRLIRLIALALVIAICLAGLTLALALDRPILDGFKGLIQSNQCCPENVETCGNSCPEAHPAGTASEECCPDK